MAMIDEAIVAVPLEPSDISVDSIRAAIARQAWAWYYAHPDTVIFQFRPKKLLGLVSFTIRVRDCYVLFVMLFGDPDSH